MLEKKIVSRITQTMLLIGMINFVAFGSVARSISSEGGSTVDWWPMFRHDLRHTGYSTSKAPKTNGTIWTYQTASLVISSPSVVNDKVYIASYDYPGYVYCLNVNDGSLIWTYPTQGQVYDSSPAISDGRVYIGTYDAYGSNYYIYCLNASDGSFIWRYQPGWGVTGSPAVADGRVYINALDNYIYCLDAANGSLVWRRLTGGGYSSPAVVEGRVYVGSYDHYVYCLNASDGSVIWRYGTGYVVGSSPSVVYGKVYVGSADSYVYCLNASEGSLLWKYLTGDQVHSSPAVAYGKVYIGSRTSYIYCLDATNGSLLWRYLTGSYVPSSPAVADGMVFIGSFDNKIYALNATNGMLIWSYKTGDVVYSSPAVAGGKVYVGSYDCKVYAFYTPPPSYTLTIYSSPTGVAFTVDGVSRTTPWSGTYSEGASVNLEMPATYDGYVWSHWSFTDTNRIKTVTMNTDITLTAVYVPVVAASVDIDPDTLNLRSKGEWITAYIQLAEDYNPEDIDANIILLNQTIQPVLDPKYSFVTNPSEYLVDHNGDGILERMVKFNRTAVSEFILSQGIWYGNVTLTITGQLHDGTLFEGSDIILVRIPGDVNSDGKVDVSDLFDLGRAYSSTPDKPNWNPNCDFNEDNKVEASDLFDLIKNYRKTAP